MRQALIAGTRAASGLRGRFYAFLAAMAVLTFGVGGLGWYHVETVSRHAEFVSQVVTPVLAENAILHEGALRLHALVIDIESQAGAAGVPGRLDEIDRASRRSLGRVDALLPGADETDGVIRMASGDFARLRARVESFREADARLRAHRTALAARLSEFRAALASALTGAAAAWPEAAFLRDSAERTAGAWDGSARTELRNAVNLFSKAVSRGRGCTDDELPACPDEAAGVVAALYGPGGALAERAAAAADEAAMGGLRKGIDEAERGYVDRLDTIGDIAREKMWRTRVEQRSVIAYARWTAVLSVAFGGILAVIVGMTFSRSVVDPLVRLTGVMRRLATGDLATLVPMEHRTDEIGDMSHALAVFKDNALRRLDLEAREAAHREEMLRSEERRRSQEALAAQNERFAAALNNMTQGLVMFDGDHRLVVCNDAYVAMFAIPDALREPGTPLVRLLERRMEAGALSRGAGYESLVCSTVPDHNVVDMQDGRSVSVMRRPLDGGGWVATYEDVTEQRLWNGRIRHLAAHDALTGLPNRVTLREGLVHALGVLEEGRGIAVHALDLDRFKNVNDSLGHQAGDSLLVQVAARVSATAGNCLVARLGGDEFAMVQAVSSVAEAEALAAAVVRSLSDPFVVDGHRITVGTSLGLTFAWGRDADPGTLLKQSDIALYSAKGSGRGRHEVFQETMEADIRERRAVEADLRTALDEGGLSLNYQPIVSIETGCITGFEALMRWNHPVRGAVPPSVFIPIAEDSGLISAIGEWAMRRACADAVTWPAGIKVAVNLSPDQFRHGEDVVAMVGRALAASGLPGSRLGVEITESLLLDDDARTLESLHALRAMGVTISLDDFGTGYSSLSYLGKFPFDRIKIDQSFVRDMLDRPDSAAIVKAVIRLAGDIAMTTVAEGVETVEQYERLRRKGCGEVQGYLISKPVPISQVPALIRGRSDARAAA